MNRKFASSFLRTPIWVLAGALVAACQLSLAHEPNPPTQTPTDTAATPAQAAPAQAVPAQAAPAQSTPAPASQKKTGVAKGSGSAIKPSATGTGPAGARAVGARHAGMLRGGMPPGGAAVKPTPPPPPPWTLFKLNPKTKILLDFTDANPDMIISIFSRTSGITIVKDPSFKLPITLTSATSVKLDEAFEIFNTVLGLNGYELQKQGRLLVVGHKLPPPPPPQPPMQPTPPPPPPPAEEKSVLHVYKLENASAAQVARVVNEVFSQQQLEAIVQQLSNGGGFQPQQQQFGRPQSTPPPKVVRASSEDYTNSVIVNAPEAMQKDVADLVKQLDTVTSLPLDSEIFRIKYVAVGDVIDAIQDVLTSNAPTGRGGKRQEDNQNQNVFYGYNPFRNQEKSSSGGQTAIAVKPTNSVIVTATAANIEVVRKLIRELDQPTETVGTTFVLHLENAKADDVANLLMKAFTKPKNGNDNSFVINDFFEAPPKEEAPTDVDESGRVATVRDLTGKVNIIADANTNSLVVVAQPSDVKLIRAVVNQLDTIAEQVMVEVVIVEANLDKDTKLGVEWNFLESKVLNSNAISATGIQDFGLQTATPLPQGFRYTLNGNGYTAFLNSLEADNRFRILSTPRIFTSNNVQAKIFVGQTLQEQTSAQSGGLGGVVATYKDLKVGVGLTVTPRITKSGEVALDVDQSADDLQGYSPQNQPIVNNRTTTTTAVVSDGATVILGGIIRTSTTIADSKVPILGDLPLLGHLFRSTNHDNAQTELLVLLTPHIVRNNADAQRIRSDQTKDLSKASQDALRHTLHPDKP